MELGSEFDTSTFQRANIYRNGRLACKVILTGNFLTREAAFDALSARLDCWIEAFESRERLAIVRVTDLGSGDAIP